jgi:hypothetical protein
MLASFYRSDRVHHITVVRAVGSFTIGDERWKSAEHDFMAADHRWLGEIPQYLAHCQEFCENRHGFDK